MQITEHPSDCGLSLISPSRIKPGLSPPIHNSTPLQFLHASRAAIIRHNSHGAYPGRGHLRLPSPQIPNGEVTSQQLRFMGAAIAPFGEEGCADITTRAGIQLRGMTLDEAEVIYSSMHTVGLSSVMSGVSPGVEF